MSSYSLAAISIVSALSLAGCANVPADPSKMTPEQLQANARDKNATTACTVLNSPWGRGVTTYTILDKDVLPNGQITIDGECKITINNTKTAPVAAASSRPD